MLDSEFMHLANKYGANLTKDNANAYLRDACRCCWDLDDVGDKFGELEARIEDYVTRSFPDMEIGKRAQLEYVLTQCLAFEIGLIDRPDEHDVSYPGVGIIAESVMTEARSGTMSAKPDFDSPIKPVCSNPATGFSKSFTTIRQAAEWVINDDNGDVPHPFGSVKASKYSAYPWENLPKHVQNSIMNNILNAACKKETRADLEDRYRDSGYGLVWELDDPAEIESEDIRFSYEEGHGSKEDRDQIKARIAAEKANKEQQLKAEKIEFVNKNKDWAISKLKQSTNSRGVSLFDDAECEPKYGYPAFGIYGYFGGDFDQKIKAIQKKLDDKMAAKGKKAKSLEKYFNYLNDVSEDLGLKIDDTGYLTESMSVFRGLLKEGTTRPVYRPFKAPSNATFDFSGSVSFTNSEGKTLEADYTVPVTVYFTEDGTEFDGYDDAALKVTPKAGSESYLSEITEKIKDLLDEDADLATDICIKGDESVADMHERYDWAYEDAVEAWQDEQRDKED